MPEIIYDEVALTEPADYALLKTQADARFDMAMARADRIGRLMNWRSARDNKQRQTVETGLSKIYSVLDRFKP